MREIKFRAWQDGCKEMYLWNDIRRNFYEHLGKPNIYIMQFTGLFDKNGKEIYEGDIIVRDGYMWFDEGKPNYRGTVEWIYSQWQVVAHCINPKKRGISDGMNMGLNDDGWEETEKSEWEVIGNIYENPNLIKE